MKAYIPGIKAGTLIFLLLFIFWAHTQKSLVRSKNKLIGLAAPILSEGDCDGPGTMDLTTMDNHNGMQIEM